MRRRTRHTTTPIRTAATVMNRAASMRLHDNPVVSTS